MNEDMLKDLEVQRKKLVQDAEYYDACGTAESSMQAQSELIGFEKAYKIMKNT